MAVPLGRDLQLAPGKSAHGTLPRYRRIAIGVVVPPRFKNDVERLADIVLGALPAEFDPDDHRHLAIPTLVDDQVLVVAMHSMWRVGDGFSPSWDISVTALAHRLQVADESWGRWDPAKVPSTCLRPGCPPLGLLAHGTYTFASDGCMFTRLQVVPGFRLDLDKDELRDADVKHSLLYLPVTDKTVSMNGVHDTLWVDRRDALDALQTHGSRYERPLPFGQHRHLRNVDDWSAVFKRWHMARKSRIPRVTGAVLEDFVVFFDLYIGTAPVNMPLWLDVLCRRFPIDT